MILVASLAMAAENPTAIRATFWSSNIADLIEPLPESSSIGARELPEIKFSACAACAEGLRRRACAYAR
jgi:hypothetical protein